MKEEQLFVKRLKELASVALNKSICIYTDFLNLNELTLFSQIEKELPPVKWEQFGGYEDCERRMICFYGEEAFQAPDYPIICLKIFPVNQKFSNVLTHRDFLGAILNLGIERCKIGDIMIKNNCGYVFCNRKIADFIVMNLFQIKQTTVSCIRQEEALFISPEYKELRGSVSSLRLDAVLALALRSSRSKLSDFISGGRVYINGKQILSNSHILKENDIISVRGFGKFKYQAILNETKKGRYSILLLKYC